MLEKKAMEIILHSGDARLKINHALTKAAEGNYSDCEQLLEEANANLVKAHEIHTAILQKIAAEDMKETYSILFTHAQDTLMTIYSEYNLAKQIIHIAENLQKQISLLQ